MSAPAPKKCAICRKPATAEFKPFCSRRCANVDLQRWFSGAYAVPVEEGEAQARDSEGDPDV